MANKNLASGDCEKAVPGEVIPRGQDWGVDAAVGADAIMNLFHPRETTALRVNSKANSELWGVVCRFTACNKRHCGHVDGGWEPGRGQDVYGKYLYLPFRLSVCLNEPET